MPKQSVQLSPNHDSWTDTEYDYEDQFKMIGAASNARALTFGFGIAYIGVNKVITAGGSVDLTVLANGSYDIVVDLAGNFSAIAVGTEAGNQLSLYRIVVVDNRCQGYTELRVGQTKGAAGGGGGVDTQEDGVAVDSPAITLNFVNGIIATGGGGLTSLNLDYGIAILPVGSANVVGALPAVARSDHVHQGVHSINGGAGMMYGDVVFAAGAGIGLVQIGQTVTVSYIGGVSGVDTQENGVAVDSPATTLNFVNGIIATGGAGTTALNLDYALVGVIANVNVVNVAGVSNQVARADHAHQGVYSVDGGGGAIYGGVVLAAGAGIGLGQLGQTVTITNTQVADAMPEKPRDYHDLVMATPTGECNGVESERSNTVLADGRVIHVRDNLDFGGTHTIIIGVEMNSEVDGTATQKRYYEIMLAVIGFDTEEPVVPNGLGIDCTAEIGVAGSEMLHIVFAGESALTPGISDIFDVYFSTAAIPQPVGGGQLTMLASCEIVNQMSAEAHVCSWPSVAAQPLLSAGAGVVVVWQQTIAPLNDAIQCNCYDPTQIPGARYNTFLTPYAQLTVNDPAEANAFKPTIECTPTYNHCAYTAVHTASGTIRLYYSNQTSPGLAVWGFCADAAPIDSYGVLALNTDDVPGASMVCMTAAGGYDLLCVAIMDNGDASSDINLYEFAHDIPSGLPSAFAERIACYFNSAQSTNIGRFYQLSVSPYEYDGATSPRYYLYKYMQGFNAYNYDVMLGYYPMQIDTIPNEEGIFWVPILCGNPSLGDPDSITFGPKAYFNYSYLQRTARVADTPWYPPSFFLRSYLGQGDQDYEIYGVIMAKDLPSWVLGETHL